MAQRSSVDVQIGEAWGLHREGRNAESINSFVNVLRSAPNSVDAHYGLGLAQRADGRETEAVETFQKTLELAQERLSEIRQSNANDGAQNILNTTDDDRFMMLTRMAQQRLNELLAASQKS